MMEYHIEYNGRKIASFLFESDRDYCLDDLQGRYPDCVLISTEGE